MATRAGPDYLQQSADAVRWHVFLWLGDADLVAAACAGPGLLLQCASARLHAHVVRLNLRQHSLLALPQRLWPGAGSAWSARDERSIRQALDFFARAGVRGDRATVALVLPWIQRGDAAMRSSAIRSVSRVAARGDRCAIDGVLGCLGEGRAVGACCEALRTLAVRGDADVVGRLRGLLAEGLPPIRCAALMALPSVVDRGDAAAVALVRARLADQSDVVRGAALHALGCLAVEGDCAVMEEMIRGLKDSSAHVRQAAMASLHVTSGGSFAAAAEAAEAAEAAGGAAYALPLPRVPVEPSGCAPEEEEEELGACPCTAAEDFRPRHLRQWPPHRRGQKAA